jgi:hypothetical protein
MLTINIKSIARSDGLDTVRTGIAVRRTTRRSSRAPPGFERNWLPDLGSNQKPAD